MTYGLPDSFIVGTTRQAIRVVARKPAHRKEGYLSLDFVLGAIVAFDQWIDGLLTGRKRETFISPKFTPKETKEKRVRFE